ncbi:MAG: tRNA dihydrouridine synthase DusB [Pseudomonadales bacterium]|nr:tRNA dihydrouridine synthase DusB [Pseudomonadales bacterium]
MIPRFLTEPVLPLSSSDIQIGSHTLKSNAALAPMAGLTDVPFRTLAWRYGAAYMVSEMVSGKVELWESGKSRLRRVPVPGVNPVAVQIAGTDPMVMAEAARRHVDEGVEVIDINFGCPAKKVCKKSAGSALLSDLPLLGHIVEAVVEAVPVPVTVKTRTGLGLDDHTGVEAGRIAETAGAAMIVMHARSRACRFVGRVDYAKVRKLKSSVAIPVVVNGDIWTRLDVHKALSSTGADGVMIGRAALGQPWLFQELTGGSQPSLMERWDVVIEHISLLHQFYGEQAGVRIARKHIEAYGRTLGFDPSACLRVEAAEVQSTWLVEMRKRQISESKKSSASKHAVLSDQEAA